jgi:hypothetical protein
MSDVSACSPEMIASIERQAILNDPNRKQMAEALEEISKMNVTCGHRLYTAKACAASALSACKEQSGN